MARFFDYTYSFLASAEEKELTNNQIKAVIFDFGETLVTFGKINSLAYFKLGAQETYDFLKSLDQPAGKFKSYRIKNITDLLLRLLISRITDKDFDSLAVLKKAGQKNLIQLDEQQWQKLVWLWYEPLEENFKNRARSERNTIETQTAGTKTRYSLQYVCKWLLP